MLELSQTVMQGVHLPVKLCGFPQTSVKLSPPGMRKAHRVVCMAHPRRIKMVAQQIKREVGQMLVTDKVVMQAVLPEAALGADMYLSSVTTVSDVEVSKDLQVAKIYISVVGDERGKEIAIEGLKSKEKYVRMELGRRMKLRLTPEVRFIADDSFERGARVIKLLDRLKEEAESKERGESIDTSSAAEDSDYDSDGNIVFVE